MATYQSSHTGAEIDAAVDAVSGKADKSEMSVVAGTGANADKTTITLKSGTSATVLTTHQDISGKANASDVTTLQGYFTNGVANSAAEATVLKTSRYIWGKSFDGSASIKGDLFMISDNSDATANTDSAKLKFNSAANDASNTQRSPYIQAIKPSSDYSYGRKRLSVFQSNAANYTDAFVEVATILPNGNVGIGTTSPSVPLEVNGNVAISGSLSLGGTPVVKVFSGSSAPSSSTGIDGDIYIQTS